MQIETSDTVSSIQLKTWRFDTDRYGSEIIDVVIGMIFVFLVLSLVCSAANEIIEAWLNKRADYLEKGIK